MVLFCVIIPQIVVFASNDYFGITNGKDGVYTVNSSGSLIFDEYGFYEIYCQNVEFMKAYILERLNKGSCDNVVYVGYHRVCDLGKAARYLFFVPDDSSIPLSDIIACPKSGTFSNGNYMEFYNKKTGLVISGSIRSFNNSADVIAGNEQICMGYNSNPVFCTVGGDYFINCPKELLLSNIKIYGYDNNIKLSALQCSEILNNAISGALKEDNENNFLPERYGVLEVPQNIRFTGGKSYGFTANKEHVFDDGNINITWTQTDPNYKLWSTEILIYGDMGVKWPFELFAEYKKVNDLFLYSDEFSTSKLKFTIDMDKMVYDNPIWISKAYEMLDSTVDLYDDSCFCVTLMIRNKYYDEGIIYYSNWVELRFDDEGMHGGVSNEETGTNTEYDYDDPINGDRDVDFTQQKPSGSVNPDSPYQGGSINPSADFSISDFIHNGFGLAGEGGLIDMFKELFSFIPAPVWTLILTGLSVLIAIALLKAVL